MTPKIRLDSVLIEDDTFDGDSVFADAGVITSDSRQWSSESPSPAFGLAEGRSVNIGWDAVPAMSYTWVFWVIRVMSPQVPIVLPPSLHSAMVTLTPFVVNRAIGDSSPSVGLLDLVSEELQLILDTLISDDVVALAVGYAHNGAESELFTSNRGPSDDLKGLLGICQIHVDD